MLEIDEGLELKMIIYFKTHTNSLTRCYAMSINLTDLL
jgi:hypothetical protein